jgi:GNAT superfamily N-acetyltransferase
MKATFSQLACKMERNFINGFKSLAGINDARFTDSEGISEFFSGYGVSWLNCVFKADGEDPSIDSKVQAVLEKYDSQCPMVWHVGALTPASELVKAVLQKYHLRLSALSPGMVLNTLSLSRDIGHDEFAVRALCVGDNVRDWLAPFASAFCLNESIARHFEIFILSKLGTSIHDHWFIGYVDGIPVSAASYFNDSGITMIYNVSTIEAFRNRGYGRRLMEYMIQHASEHFDDPIGLYASDLGFLLYESLGFEEVYFIEEFSFP